MPNWCQNNIQFEGGEHLDEIKEILSKNPDGILRFEDFGHTPEQRIDEYYQKVEISQNKINISCMTSWAAPLSFLKHMSLMFPGTKITLQYCEDAMRFAGESTFEAYQQNVVSFWSSQLGNWENPSLSDLEDEEEEALCQKMSEAARGSEEVKELMDKIYNKDLSDFMFQHFGAPVGG